jgi:Uncharacterized protein conserved in bacteria
MPLNEALLPEFDHEMANTRKTLERVPEDKLSWRPHEKSASLGWLATHLANLPSWTIYTLGQDQLDLDPPGGPKRPPLPEAKSRQELLAMFDKNRSAAREAISQATDSQLLQPWSLLKGGATVLSMPRIAVLRSFVMNHMIHHRGQLTVYLRVHNVPVPALYGPSADEGAF